MRFYFMDQQQNGKKEYSYSDYFNSTVGVQILSTEKVLNEKISSLTERIKKLENRELKREDRKFQLGTLIIGAILGFILTIIAQFVINKLN